MLYYTHTLILSFFGAISPFFNPTAFPTLLRLLILYSRIKCYMGSCLTLFSYSTYFILGHALPFTMVLTTISSLVITNCSSVTLSKASFVTARTTTSLTCPHGHPKALKMHHIHPFLPLGFSDWRCSSNELLGTSPRVSIDFFFILIFPPPINHHILLNYFFAYFFSNSLPFLSCSCHFTY